MPPAVRALGRHRTRPTAAARPRPPGGRRRRVRDRFPRAACRRPACHRPGRSPPAAFRPPADRRPPRCPGADPRPGPPLRPGRPARRAAAVVRAAGSSAVTAAVGLRHGRCGFHAPVATARPDPRAPGLRPPASAPGRPGSTGAWADRPGRGGPSGSAVAPVDLRRRGRPGSTGASADRRTDAGGPPGAGRAPLRAARRRFAVVGTIRPPQVRGESTALLVARDLEPLARILVLAARAPRRAARSPAALQLERRARSSSGDCHSRPRANHFITASGCRACSCCSVGSSSSCVCARNAVGLPSRMIVQ